MQRVRKWAVIGRFAAIAQTNEQGKSKLEFETDLAARLNLKRGALRNYADAVRLVRELPDPALRKILFRSSAVGASTLARWLLLDPLAARNYIDDNSVDGAVTNDRALLVAARRSRRPMQPRRAMPESAVAQLKTWLDGADDVSREELVRRLAPQISGAAALRLAVDQPSGSLGKLLGLSAVLHIALGGRSIDPAWKQPDEHSDGYASLGIIDIPPLVVLERFRAEARSVWTRALAATVYVDVVALVLPSSAARRHLLSRLPLEGAEWINHPPASRSLERSMRCESRPVITKIGRRKIIVSTTRSFLKDLLHEDQLR